MRRARIGTGRSYEYFNLIYMKSFHRGIVWGIVFCITIVYAAWGLHFFIPKDETPKEIKIVYFSGGDCTPMWGNYGVGTKVYDDQVKIIRMEGASHALPITRWQCFQ